MEAEDKTTTSGVDVNQGRRTGEGDNSKQIMAKQSSTNLYVENVRLE